MDKTRKITTSRTRSQRRAPSRGEDAAPRGSEAKPRRVRKAVSQRADNTAAPRDGQRTALHAESRARKARGGKAAATGSRHAASVPRTATARDRAAEAPGAKNRGRDGLVRKSDMVFLAVALLALAVFALVATLLGTSSKTEEKPAEEPVQDTAPAHDAEVERLLADLTLEQKVAQLFVVTPEALTGVDVAVNAGDTTRDAVSERPVGGLVYSVQNLEYPEQVQTLTKSTQNYAKDACGLPVLTCVEELGGDLVQVANNSAFEARNMGSALSIGTTEDDGKARESAYTTARYLRDLGLNTNLAPCASVAASEDEAESTGSFGTSTELVSAMVGAQVEGYLRGGVLCVPGQFPGTGGAQVLERGGRLCTTKTVEQLLSSSLMPFRSAIDEGAPLIMVGNVWCLHVGGGAGELPASLSPQIVDGILRERLGYGGVVITAPLGSSELAGVCDARDQAVLAIQAGCDMVLRPSDFDAAYEGLLDAVERGEVSEERIDDSVRRIIAAKLLL